MPFLISKITSNRASKLSSCELVMTDYVKVDVHISAVSVDSVDVVDLVYG